MTDQEKKLLEVFARLSEEDAYSVLRFAEFLSGNPTPDVARNAVSQSVQEQAGVNTAIAKPEPIERPAQETVVAALKRLSSTYPMLDKDQLLHEASALVAEHVMGGRPAREVIDEIEKIFKRGYDKYVEQAKGI